MELIEVLDVDELVLLMELLVDEVEAEVLLAEVEPEVEDVEAEVELTLVLLVEAEVDDALVEEVDVVVPG